MFPLRQIDLANPDEAFGLMIGSDEKVPSYKIFRLPLCSHNALLLDGQKLYTSELISGGGRRLEYYMPLPLMKVLLPLGLLSTWGMLSVSVIVVAMVAWVMRGKTRIGSRAREK